MSTGPPTAPGGPEKTAPRPDEGGDEAPRALGSRAPSRRSPPDWSYGGAPPPLRAGLVRDLAIRGADAVLAERREREAGLEYLIDWSTDPASGMDRDVLLHGRDEAWGDGR